jgi:hypothetical protein
MTKFHPLHRSNERPEPSRDWVSPCAALAIPVLIVAGIIGGLL